MEKGYIRTFVAKAEGRRLTVRFPGPVLNSTDLRSESAATDAAKYIRAHGVDCNFDALNRLVNNF